MKTKTVYLVYRPVLGYEESEECYLVCETEAAAKEIISKCFELAQKYLSKLKNIDDNSISDEEFNKGDKFNQNLWNNIKWPYKINISRWDVEGSSTSFVAYRAIPMVIS